ncbi:hypothetical protein Clacol_009397 [Clathrus columnatus]|uniref:DUF7053 domain-containing protein n=1 Tax=Clathrus columnatus TaxID=1419009 RepID=A0AAV5AKD5_9AGAM|nr:hypothetical protein Clacol_009397 [Clathrus columnatus]
MSWKKTSHSSESRQIRASKESIVAFLHDPNKFFLLSSLVASVDPVPDTPGSWTVIHLIPTACWKTAVTSHVVSTFRVDGITSVVTAKSMGFTVTTSSTFTVDEMEKNVCEVVEESSVTGNILMMPYINATHSSSHRKLFDRLKERLENEAK